MLDLGEGNQIGDPDKPLVTVFGFDEVVQVLRDNETYSSNVYADVMGMVMGRTILEMDEPEHRGIRALVASSFRSKMLERWEEELVSRVVNELIDGFVDDGRTDLVRSVTFNFPVQVIARILGLPRADYPKFQRWALELTSVAANWSAAWRRRPRCVTTSPRSWRNGAPRRVTTSSATWYGPRWTGST